MAITRHFSSLCVLSLFLIAGLLGATIPPLRADGEQLVPDDVFRPFYFVDVTKPPYSIDNTGKEDVTVKLRAVIQDIWHGGFPALRQKTLYFPNGIYRLSDTLDTVGVDKAGKTVAVHRLRWLGQSRDKTIFKLDDNLPAFQDPKTPRPMLKTESIGVHGNDAYNNFISNITFDTGAGNPGAAGISYFANNNGELSDVCIRAADGSGAVGLLMNRQWPGPALVKNLEIDGFNLGIELTKMEYSITFEHIVLKNQREAGFLNLDNGAFIRDLKSANTVPAIVNGTATGLIVVVDSNFSGGDPKNPAVKNAGGAFLRNIQVSGYGSAVDNTVAGGGPSAPAGNITEYTSHPVLTNKAFTGSRATSLNLEARETPVFEDNDLSHWYSVGNKTKPDAVATVDQTQEVQAAIDEAASQGKTTFYFIPGEYHISRTLNFHGSIRRVLGFGTFLRPLMGGDFDTPAAELPPPPVPKPPTPMEAPGTTATAAAPAPPPPSPSNFKNNYGAPVIRASDLTGDSIEFSLIEIDPISTARGKLTFYGFQQDTPKTVILRDFQSDEVVYRSTEHVGDLYVETGVGNGWFFDHPGQKIWARQLDPEGNASPKVINVGSKLWVLGFKTERDGIQLDTSAGGESEILGAIFYPVRRPNDEPAFRVDNASLSASYVTINNSVTPDFPRQLLEIRGKDEQVLHPEDTYPRPCFGGSRAAMVPLVVAAPADSKTVSTK